jgi:hypothetical protein
VRTATALVQRLVCANCGSIRIDALWPAYVDARIDVTASPGLQPRDGWHTELTDEWRPHGGSVQCRDCTSNADPVRRYMTVAEWEELKARAAAADQMERERHEWVPDAASPDKQRGIYPDPDVYADRVIGPLPRDKHEGGWRPGCFAGRTSSACYYMHRDGRVRHAYECAHHEGHDQAAVQPARGAA